MKTVLPALAISILLIVWAINAANNQPSPSVVSKKEKIVNNVTIVDDIQIIDLEAKGGYEPRKSVAQANIPTKIRFNTSSTYDCSTIVRIPSQKFQKTLPSTGVTEIDIGSQPVSVFKGSCGMGMYPFEIEFK